MLCEKEWVCVSAGDKLLDDGCLVQELGTVVFRSRIKMELEEHCTIVMEVSKSWALI